MIFLIGVIFVAVGVLVIALFGANVWKQGNAADFFGGLFFWAGVATVGLSCVIALVKVMP